MKDNNQGFPPALTHENLAAALKRAADAEDHLRREVASNQALIALAKDRTISAALQDKSTIAKLREQLQARDQTIADLQDKIETALLSEWRGGPDADVRVESDHIIIAFPTPNGEWAHAYKHTVSEALTLRRRLETALSTVPGTEMGEGIWEG